MHRLIPSFISEQFDRGQFNGDFQAITMFIDIAGFTAMTQTLMNNGKEGAEVLADVINQVFTPAIEVIHQHGGFVSSFAGDAFTAIFPSKSVAIVDALSAGVRLQELFQEEGVHRTKFASFTLSVRISLSSGSVVWGIISHERQNAFYFAGGAIQRCIGNKQYSDEGEVIFDEQILPGIEGLTEVKYINKTDHLYSLQSAPSSTSKVVPEIPIPFNQNRFIPHKVLSMQDRGEFRDIVSCFISFDGNWDIMTGTARIISLVQDFGGYFNKIDFRDDGEMILVLFGAPFNPGNLYNRALDFALAVREIPELSVRIGLSCGTAFTGFVGSELRSEYTALGSVVNLSSRFTQNSERDDICLDQPIYEQVQAQYRIMKLKANTFKGFKRKIPVYSLTGRIRSLKVSIFNKLIIGRERELSLLAEFMQPLKESKFGGVVYVYGNPGIGKSRLVHELTKRLGIRTLILQTDSILKKPLNPFKYFFSQYFDQDEEGSPVDRKGRFTTIYQELIGRMISLSDAEKRIEIMKELSRIKSIIGSIIGLFWDDSVYDMIAPEDRAVVTQLAIKEFFTALSMTESIIMLIEDIQWLDDESKAVFETLTRQIEDYPLILLVTSRFNDDGSRPELKVNEDVPCNEIVLNKLSVDHTRVLIEDRLGSRTDRELAAFIHTRTEGNPFYTEQFCLYLQENGIIKVQDGQYHLITKPSDIPSDINMTLITRIDRLTTELKEMVQIASVLGREFEFQVLNTLLELQHDVTSDAGISLMESEIRQMISKIEEEGIWSALTEFTYIFNHALLRDAAYDMQLRTRLRNLHKLAGDAIVNLYPDDETFYADCAHHYELAEDWDKARAYCQKTGDYFYESVQYDEALMYRQKTLSICLNVLGDKHPDTAQSYFNMGTVTSDKGDYEMALSNQKKALAIRKEVLGEKHSDTARSYHAIGEAYLCKDDYEMALLNHDRAISIRREILGENHPDTALSYSEIGAVHFDKGDYNSALAFYEKALDIEKEKLGEKSPNTACSYNNIGHVHSVKGDYVAALDYYNKALAIQKELRGEKHPHTATLYNNIGSVYCKKEEYEKALEYNEKAQLIQKELLGEKHPSTALSYNNIGMSHYLKGDFDIALVYFMKALAIRKELLGENHPDTANSYNNIGSVYRENGDLDTALSYNEKALVIQKDLLDEKHPSTAISMGNIAKLYISLGKYRKAEQYYRQALIVFENSLGESHPYTISTLQQMLKIYEKTDNEPEANRIQERLKILSPMKSNE